MTPVKEAELLENLAARRWGKGVYCPRCGHDHCYVHTQAKPRTRRKLRCGRCARSFNELTGTTLARSHLSLEKWAAAARIMTVADVSCSELSRKIGVKVATAWKMRRVLRATQSDRMLWSVLTGKEE
ncbi:MAG: transposase [Elusimicrobiota bacterium]